MNSMPYRVEQGRRAAIRVRPRTAIAAVVLIAAGALVGGCGSRRSVLRETAEVTNPSDTAYYNQVIDQLTSERIEPSEIDFVRFRLSVFRNAPERARPEVYERLDAAGQGERYAAMVELADSVLVGNFADIRAHVYAAVAYKRSGSLGAYDMHMLFANGMLHSIVDGRGGKSPDNAFHVYFVENELAVLEYLGLEMLSQRLQVSGGRTFDVVECKESNGVETSVYFDVTEHVSRLVGSKEP